MAVDIDAELAKRKKARDERIKAIRDAQRVPTVTVSPTKPEYRKHLKHGLTGVAFPEGEGNAVWPHDQFTKRRIKDGSVKLVEDDKKNEDDKKKPAGRLAPPEKPAA